MKTIYVNGGKGGVGKSLIVKLCIEYFNKQKINPYVVDGDIQQDILNSCDTGNKTKNNIAGVEFINLRDEAGNDWNFLIDYIQKREKEKGVIIVNSPAGENDNMLNFGAALDEVKDLTILFAFVNDYVCRINLQDQIETTSKPICVVLNKMFSNSMRITEFDKFKDIVPNVTLGMCPQPYREHIINNNLLYSEVEDAKKMPKTIKLMGSKWLRESVPVIGEAIKLAAVVDPKKMK